MLFLFDHMTEYSINFTDILIIRILFQNASWHAPRELVVTAVKSVAAEALKMVLRLKPRPPNVVATIKGIGSIMLGKAGLKAGASINSILQLAYFMAHGCLPRLIETVRCLLLFVLRIIDIFVVARLSLSPSLSLSLSLSLSFHLVFVSLSRCLFSSLCSSFLFFSLLFSVSVLFFCSSLIIYKSQSPDWE